MQCAGSRSGANSVPHCGLLAVCGLVTLSSRVEDRALTSGVRDGGWEYFARWARILYAWEEQG